MLKPQTPQNKAKSATKRATYHHGNLRQAMIDAAVLLVEEVGAEAVTVREAARRAGVSPGAPFKHFKSKQDLMRAVAEDGMSKFRSAIEVELSRCRSTHPMRRLAAIADAYFGWAVQNPTHFRVLGDRNMIDFWQSEALVRDNGWIHAEMTALMHQAAETGLLKPCDVTVVHLQMRALAYGLARMYVDGHLSEFKIAPQDAQAKITAAAHAFIESLAVNFNGVPD
jgi:AcrR family transcriptional regulator